MEKFKVGQKVRVVGYNDQSYPNMMPVGTVCEVVDIMTAQGPETVTSDGRWAINYPSQAHKFEAVADEPQADTTKAAVLAWVKDCLDAGVSAAEADILEALLHDLFCLEVRRIPATVEFVPV